MRQARARFTRQWRGRGRPRQSGPRLACGSGSLCCASFSAGCRRRNSEIAEAITREAGKPVAEALTTEVLVVLDAARFLIENAYRLLRNEPLPHGNLATKLKRGRLLREPYGVIGIISPWNYPFSIPATETLAALVAGNAVVLKPSEFTSLVALELKSLLHAAGIPATMFFRFWWAMGQRVLR